MSSFLISLNFEINESATAILDIKIFNVIMKNNFILPIFVFIYFFIIFLFFDFIFLIFSFAISDADGSFLNTGLIKILPSVLSKFLSSLSLSIFKVDCFPVPSTKDAFPITFSILPENSLVV